MSAALRLYAADAIGVVRGGPGGELSADMRLSEIYWAHIEPVQQMDAQPRNLESLRCSLAYWVRFTGDPPLRSIDQAYALLRDDQRPADWTSQAVLGSLLVKGLKGLPGKRARKLGANSVVKHVAAIQAMLDLCGPPDARRRDALGLVGRAPYLQRPGKTKRPPEDCYSLAEIELLLASADAARCPHRLSITAGEYMRRLYLLLFNTGMRVQEAMLVRWGDDRGHYLDLEPRVVAKGRDGRRVQLNEAARRLVDEMRGVHLRGRTFERIFPWPWDWAASRSQLYKQHDLVRVALPEQRRRFMAFHSFRKATANELVKINTMGAQKQLGHATAKMTGDHYVSEQAAQDAVRQLPQPIWRLDRQARLFD